MTLASCVFCARPVLELAGQFDILHGYMLDPAGPPDVPCGECHRACLVASPWAPLWAERRAHHQAHVLRHDRVAQDATHQAFRDPRNREWVVVAANAEVFSWRFGDERRARPTPGGKLIAIEQEYNLELPGEPAVIAEAQAALTDAKRYALPALVERLGIADVMRHPAALEDGAFVLDRALRAYWSATALSARVRYARFIPDEVLALVAAIDPPS